MTIYTVMGANRSIEWIAKSFTCRQTANEFLDNCLTATRIAHSLKELLVLSPDPTIHTDLVKRTLSIDHAHYTLHVNELVTDEFMELTLQPHKPKPFKDLL